MKKRILFVDDERDLLNGLRRALRGQRKEWEMAFAGSGKEALELAESNPFDAIVTDMRMPGMDGAQLLEELVHLQPDIVRIVLSGQSDKEMVMKSVLPAHQYLNKPCDIDHLKSAIIRAFALRELIHDDKLVALISGMESLPSLPSLYLKLVDMLKDSDVTVRAVGEMLAKDLAMTSKVLQLVNSAFFGLGRRITNPVDAASLLGMDIIKGLVLSIGIFSQCDQSKLQSQGFSVDRLWVHSSKVASIAKRIAVAEQAEKSVVEDSMLAGFLHDIGKLILALNLPEMLQQLQMASQDGGLAGLHHAEEVALGTTHGGVGAYLLGLWGLPEGVVSAVAFHHDPSTLQDAEFSTLTAVHIADVLANDDVSGGYDFDHDYLQRLGMEDRIEAWRQLALE
ncbi:MAG: hypothetical protein OI74_00095 [Gammaproteobacteria bacterium (ex Lamellibrachia satsuma)]|nr:MAG: HDOD domain-containing protein [Gammaproteobacteria bacterium (ex Lamellibrachia satsuma)]RRS36082.1 MAG: hypothetical protein OI74_00095 [Gammaproteobacteria bacterium (ex Lamellibrachia satsuma)]RRS37212.1 MAG: hypothetical protein NV67_02115 [Gammaproteobacteria bacterium (ex Lamellibrachia satsuma)]